MRADPPLHESRASPLRAGRRTHRHRDARRSSRRRRRLRARSIRCASTCISPLRPIALDAACSASTNPTRRGQRAERMSPSRRPTTERSPSAPTTIRAAISRVASPSRTRTPVTRPLASRSTSVTATPSATRAPAARARSSRIESNISRRTPSAGVALAAARRAPRRTVPRTSGRSRRESSSPRGPARPRGSLRRARPSPRECAGPAGSDIRRTAFDRGKCARSSTSTSTPLRASAHAVVAPAGPPPTTTTSRRGQRSRRHRG